MHAIKGRCYTCAVQMWVRKQQHQHHLGVYEKCRIPGPAPDLLHQNLPFSKAPGDFYVHESLRITALKMVSTEIVEIFIFALYMLPVL